MPASARRARPRAELAKLANTVTTRAEFLSLFCGSSFLYAIVPIVPVNPLVDAMGLGGA